MNPAAEKRVERLLRPLKQREELARQELSRVRGAAQRTAATIERIGNSLRVHSEFARRELLGGGRKEVLSLYRRCVTDLAAAAGRGRQELASLEPLVDQRRAELIVCRKERQAMERLAQRLAAQRRAAQVAADTREADEMFTASQAWLHSPEEASVSHE